MVEYTVEVDFGSGFATPLASRSYTNISGDVEGAEALTITHGRADELAAPDPGTVSVVLDNSDGTYTPEKTTSPYYPNVKVGKPLRVAVTYPGNLLSANQASMETSVADWSPAGGPTLAQSATHVQDGAQALRITWPTGGIPYAKTTVAGLVVGRAYTFSAYVWVTTGTPNVVLGVETLSSGTASTIKGSFQRISYTFTAALTTHVLYVAAASATTAGQQCWVDAAQLEAGSSATAFTTVYGGPQTRFTGYVDSWPVTWPDGSDAVSQSAVSGSTRRARLGERAPLTSAIRAAYLASDPLAYWPMDEPIEVVDSSGRQAFRDITNSGARRDREVLGAFSSTAALAPVVRDGSVGPTDEQSLVKFPPQTTFDTFAHYVGSGNAVVFNTAGEMTVEAVARIRGGTADAMNFAYIFGVWTSDQSQSIEWVVASDGTGDVAQTGGGPFILYIDPATGASVGSDIVDLYDPPTYATATDGEIHHYGLTMTGGNTITAYLDGVAVRTGVLDAPFTYDRRFTNIAFSQLNHQLTVWVGHGAVHDRCLTAAEMLARATAATAASETVEERVIRVAGRLGVPANEIAVEDTIAPPLGPQPEAGRSGAEVLDEVASSTGGIFYDSRDGMLAMQARNHRYNASAAVTLSATDQEVQGDLEGVLDRRYLINTVDATRSTQTELPFSIFDQDSIDEYGIFKRDIQVVAAHELEVEAAAQNLITRFAQPRLRVSRFTVDVVNLDAAQRALILAADVGTKVVLNELPGQAPTDTITLFVEGYTETLTATSHTITFNATPADNSTVWILGSGTLGVLGSTTNLAY